MTPRLFAAGNPPDRQTDGRSGAIAATVLLALLSGAAGLFGLFVLSYASDPCAETSTAFVCTAAGQQFVTAAPLLAAVAGTVISACSVGLRPGYRALGVTSGYTLAAGAFLTALTLAH